ncbi:polysaccharide deacetylase family protein [Kineococcus sp. NBC_00420]|uniref:polysaccharide deacetylase family protein n=1 Tax=Kineococcus sp. NBC_00420 TaxID=2903564 RepID=UPI002E246048
MEPHPPRRVRLVAALSATALGVLGAYAAPALSARGPLRRATPALTGRGRPGGIALTFDDGPDPEGTPAVLTALAALGWKATFFMLGRQVRRYPQVARSVVTEGHEVAIHGDEHRNHLTRSPAWIHRDLARACGEVRAVTGTSPRWFRPPYGVLSAGSLHAAATFGLTPVLWTSWGRDWEVTTAPRILQIITRDLADRGTVLLHDSDCTSTAGSWRATAETLPLLGLELARRELEVRTLSEHIDGVR